MSERPLDLAARALRHRDRSRAQLDARLQRAGVDEATRHDALETLERVGYVDDARFAAARAAALAGRSFGDAAIRHDLESSGLAADVVEAALAAVEPEPARAEAVVARRGRRAKTGAYLARKGFDEAVIADALGVADAPLPQETLTQ